MVTFLGDCLGESLGKSFNVRAASWPNSGNILGQMPRIFGQAFRIAGGVSPSSLGNYWRRGGYWPNLRWHSWATALGSPAGSLAKCLGGVLAESWGRRWATSLGGALGKPCQVPRDLGKFLGKFLGKVCKVLGRSWPNLEGILGRLPWGVLREVLPSAWGVLADPGGVLGRLTWELLGDSLPIAGGVSAGFFGGPWERFVKSL